MIDRTDFELRLDAHRRMARAMNGQGWRQVLVVPMPAPHAALAALLLRLAARLDPAAAPPADHTRRSAVGGS